MIYCGMCSNGLARCSWQKGSLPAVHISVSCDFLLSVSLPSRFINEQETYRLQRLLNLLGEGAALQGNNLRGGIGVVGDGRAAVAAEPAPDGVARVGDALPLLDGAVDCELVLGDDADEGCFLGVSMLVSGVHGGGWVSE